MRIIGLDIHRAFAEAVAWQEGKLKRIGRIDVRRDQLKAFAASLLNTDVVVVEATGNAARRGGGDQPAREAGRDCQPHAGAGDRPCQGQDRHH